MRNKEVISNRLEQLRNNIKNTRYLMSTNGGWDEILASFDVSFDTLEVVENLINIEPDEFGSKLI